MSNLINYLLEANFALLVFTAFYWLVLRNETDFSIKRYYILLATSISLFVPLVDLSASDNNFTSLVGSLPTIMLPALEIGTVQENIQATANGTNWWRWAVYAYAIVSFTLLVLLCNQIFRIIQIVHNKKGVQKDGYKMIITDGQFPTFSFFSWLFFDNSVALSTNEKAKIIAHERVHIDQWHSLDILLIEIARLLCWINPSIWWLQRELRETHEYLADEQMIKSTQNDEYSALLAKMTLQKLSISLGNHFNKSLTIKRIRMMKTIKNKAKTWKSASAILLLTMVFIAFSCNEDVVQEMTDVLNTSTMAEMPEEFKSELARLQAKHPTAKFTYVESDMSNEKSINNFKEIDPATIGFIKVMKDNDGDQRIGMLVNSTGKINEIQSLTFDAGNDDGEEIFTVVENQPQPVDGMSTFYKNIAQKIQYPAEARKAGVQGKVYVQFVVNEDGSLSKMTVVKGIGHGCDESAINAIANAGEWKPGTQRGKAVKVRLILPITFKLDDVSDANENKSVGIIYKSPNALSEIVVASYGSN